jgi:hyperosmotically inducible periplasmic protein
MAGPGRSGGPAACTACGCGVHRIDREEEVTKVSRLIKRGPYVGVAVAVLCGVAACASGPPKNESQVQADKVMSERVEAALNADRSLFAKHITAHADNGVVRLTGYIWEASDFEEANYIASNVPGVTRVVNDLELNRNGNDNGPTAR